MAIETTAYGMRIRTAKSYDAAVAATRGALKDVGFGVLTEIDVPKVLREKLGFGFRPYIILGACNPQFSHQALLQELEIGLLLPCNVIVYQDGDGSVIAAMDPVTALGVVKNPDLEAIASQVRSRLEAALQSLAD